MLRSLPPTFKPVNNLICCKTGLMWVVKRAISLFNLLYSNVARQVARFHAPLLILLTCAFSSLLDALHFLCFFPLLIDIVGNCVHIVGGSS